MRSKLRPKKNKTAVLEYLESTTYRGESYDERQRRRIAYLAGMDQGTVLFIPMGVSQAPACDGNFYQISQERANTNRHQQSYPFR